MERGFQGQAGQQVPQMPDDFVDQVSSRYIELYEQITGEKFTRADISDVAARIEKNVTSFLEEFLR